MGLSPTKYLKKREGPTARQATSPAHLSSQIKNTGISQSSHRHESYDDIKMNSHSALRPHNRSPLGKRSKLNSFQHSTLNSFPKNLSKSRLVDHTDCSPEKAGIYFLAETKAVQTQHQQQKPPLVDTLEAELLANVMDCTELRRLTEARKRGIPVSLSTLDLGCKQEHGLGLEGGNFLLEKLDALVLVKEEECTKVRKLLAEARERETTRTPKDTTISCPSLSSHMKVPRSILRKHSSFKSTKALTWGTVTWEAL